MTGKISTVPNTSLVAAYSTPAPERTAEQELLILNHQIPEMKERRERICAAIVKARKDLDSYTVAEGILTSKLLRCMVRRGELEKS